jgi:hypothetical protein
MVIRPDDLERGYHEAATARGLLEDNIAWVRTLEEAARERMGCRAFRSFFARTCAHSIPPNRQALFDHFLNELAPRIGNETVEQQTQRAYQHLEYIFRQSDSTCQANGLEGPRNYNSEFVERDMEREPTTEYLADDPGAHQTRNWWQRYADRNKVRFNSGQAAQFNRLLSAVESNDPSAMGLFRLKGEGGSGELNWSWMRCLSVSAPGTPEL